MNGSISALEREGKKPAVVLDDETKDENDSKDQNDKGLFCAWCGNPITSREYKTEINGKFDHTFANPGGHIFHIGCFKSAPGSEVAGRETGEFTWFAGYVWSAAICVRCRSHLGWRFRGADDEFFGLIMDRLVEKESRGA